MTTFVPDSRPFYIQSNHLRLLHHVEDASQRGQVNNVLLEGPQGSGKSEIPTQFAAHHKRPIAVLEVGQLGDPKEIFGYMTAEEGTTRFVKGLFTEAISTPRCVVHLQEINRPESDRALNAIFSVLDETFRAIHINELGLVRVAPGVTFFASLNQGYEFVGTMPMDSALRDRFDYTFQIGYPDSITLVKILHERSALGGGDPMDEELISTMVDLVSSIRGRDVQLSVRSILNIAELVAAGFSYVEAFTMGSNFQDKEAMEKVLLGLHLNEFSTGTPDDGFVPFEAAHLPHLQPQLGPGVING